MENVTVGRLLRKARTIGVRTMGDRLSDVLSLVDTSSPLLASAYAAIEQWLKVAALRELGPESPRVGVCLMRNRYWMEWTAYCCCRLRLMGYEPVLLYSGDEVEDFTRQRFLLDPNQRGFWAKVRANTAFRTLDLDLFLTEGLSDEERERFWLPAQRSVAYDEERENVFDDEAIGARAAELAAFARAAQAVARELRLSRVVLPSGIIGRTSGLLAGFRDADLEVICTEAWSLWPGHMSWNLNMPVFDFDFRGWFDVIGDLAPEASELIEAYLRAQENPARRDQAWRQYRFVQPVSIDAALPPDLQAFLEGDRPTVLLGTNVIGDSATLGRETLFGSQVEWLEEILAWFKARPQYRLLIRVHPGEAMGPAPVPLAPWAEPRVRELDNVHVVSPQVQVNTYRLAREICAGLLWVSNLGVDLVARRVPVIGAARAPYAGLGIGEEPDSKERYFALLEQAAEGELVVSPASRQAALKQMFVFTRLIGLPALPFVDHARYLPLSATLDDGHQLYYAILAGERGRADHLAATLAPL